MRIVTSVAVAHLQRHLVIVLEGRVHTTVVEIVAMSVVGAVTVVAKVLGGDEVEAGAPEGILIHTTVVDPSNFLVTRCKNFFKSTKKKNGFVGVFTHLVGVSMRIGVPLVPAVGCAFLWNSGTLGSVKIEEGSLHPHY